jgi:hypothetical protein
VYLLYVDEFGNPSVPEGFALAGVAVHESRVADLTQELEELARTRSPIASELHARAMGEQWLHRAFHLLARAGSERHHRYPVRMFGVVGHAGGGARAEYAYELLLDAFDELLARESASGRTERGLVIHDDCSLEDEIQEWTRALQHASGMVDQLDRVCEVPLCADSRSTRLLQAADLVAYALGMRRLRDDGRWYGLIERCFHDRDGRRGTVIAAEQPAMKR